MKAAVLALGIMLSAPYQCATEPNERPTEDSAPKALWMLSEKFQKDGQSDARVTTLQQLVEQYPSSRYAERARVALASASKSGAGEPAGDESTRAAGTKDDGSGDMGPSKRASEEPKSTP